jgi:TolB-like protein/DNA-binding winged helix-turn-helix (wHTH) protein
MTLSPIENTVRFGLFELDLRTRQLTKNGVKIRLPQQSILALSLLLERRGEIVTREELQQRLWPSDVFVDFDHGLNKSIQKLRDALGDLAGSPRYIETIPRIGYRFIGPANGATEIGELRSDTNTPPPQNLASAPQAGIAGSRRARWLLIAACIALGALAAGWLIRWRLRTSEPIQSLAVLPLDNLSGDPSQEYFADGMTDELITMLAKNSTLRVVSRTSVMQYKGARRPLPEIARALGVDGILEGSIARSGEKVHMTIQLIQAPSDTHLWAESYDRSSNDVAALPREAALDVASRLHSSMASITPARYINPAAHDAYLQGRYLWWEGDNDASFPYFKKATELQPDYALAWFGLSSYYGAGAMFGQLDPQPALPQEDFTAQKCLQLDPSASECHLAMAGDELLSKWNVEEALRETSRAIELDPKSADAYELRSRILQALNRQEESIQAQKIALEFNPADPWTLALALWIARRYDAALTDVQQRVVATPRDPILQLLLAMNYRGKGMDKESIQCLEKYYLYAEGPASADALHRAFERGGTKAAVEWQIKFVKARAAKHYVSPVDLAELYAQLRDREQTLALLEEAFRQHAPGLLWIQCDSAYDFLHSDERYRSIIRRVGLPPAY